jgi:hypothetical protein
MTDYYGIFIMGQGGGFTSPGLYEMADVARSIGLRSDVFEYDDIITIQNKVKANHGVKLIGVGYSLGCSTVTWLQKYYPFELILCIAASTLGLNYEINKENTKRSVLWRVPDTILSGAGSNLNFDVIHDMDQFHLLMDLSPVVQTGVLNEIKGVLK